MWKAATRRKSFGKELGSEATPVVLSPSEAHNTIAISIDYPSIERILAAKLELLLTQTGQRHFPFTVFMPSLGDREYNIIKQ